MDPTTIDNLPKYNTSDVIINIIVPVCSLHIKYLTDLIKSIRNQTRKPDRVIFVLNEYEKYESEYLKIVNENNDFVYVKINSWKKAGENRNIGYDYVIQSDDSIIIFFDVDDLMSKIFCQTVGFIFKKFKFDLLLCGSTGSSKKICKIYDENYISVNTLSYENENKKIRAENICYFPEKIGLDVAFGNCIISYNALKNGPRWTNMPRGEDKQFVNDIHARYKNTYMTRLNLIHIVGCDHIRIFGGLVHNMKKKIVLNYKPILE